MKKTLFKKVEDYANKLLAICPNQKEVSVEETYNGVIILKTYYYDKEAYNTVEIRNENDLKQLKYYDKRDLKKGYLI